MRPGCGYAAMCTRRAKGVSMHFNTLVARVATGDARTASVIAALVPMSLFYALTRRDIDRRYWPMRRSDVRSNT